MKTFNILILILSLITINSNPVIAKEIFRCLRVDGTIEYTRTPTADCQSKVIKNRGGQADQAAIDKLRRDQDQAAEQARKSRLEDQQRADEKHAEEEKEDYCQKTRNNLTKLSNINRIFETDAQGNRIRLSEEQRQQRIQQVSSDLAGQCK